MRRWITLLAIAASTTLAAGQYPRAGGRAVQPRQSRSAPAKARQPNSTIERARRQARIVEQQSEAPRPTSPMRPNADCGNPGRPTRQPAGALTSEQRAAREFLNLRLDAKQTRAALDKINKLDWHEKLSSAAKVAKKTGKPILWIQMLGKLGSFT